MSGEKDHRRHASSTPVKDCLRIGALGAARITPLALLFPAQQIPGVRVSAIASRSTKRASIMARQYGVDRIHDSYQTLLADGDIDAVYIALPNAYHAEYIIQALRQGKHVLCEKPLTSNAEEALAVQVVAADYPSLVLMDAYHWRYHPIAEDMANMVQGLGSLREIQLVDAFPLLRPHDIRWDIVLGGGAMMDVGCYPLSLLTLITNTKPQVVRANARTHRGQIDRCMNAQLQLENGALASITASMMSRSVSRQSARIVGESGVISARNIFTAHRHGSLTLALARRQRRRVDYAASPTTYEYQLRAFAAAIKGEGANRTPVSDSVRIMSLIDDIYRGAGLLPRPSRLGPVEQSPEIGKSRDTSRGMESADG